ncbi:MAG: hypothetical protein N3D11_13960 [Candidatus Sumerlaeia bacterium]|nr:hypothetical protein [Candidatus Sumerlaeia bacterium]
MKRADFNRLRRCKRNLPKRGTCDRRILDQGFRGQKGWIEDFAVGSGLIEVSVAADGPDFSTEENSPPVRPRGDFLRGDWIVFSLGRADDCGRCYATRNSERSRWSWPSSIQETVVASPDNQGQICATLHFLPPANEVVFEAAAMTHAAVDALNGRSLFAEAIERVTGPVFFCWGNFPKTPPHLPAHLLSMHPSWGKELRPSPFKPAPDAARLIPQVARMSFPLEWGGFLRRG